MSLVALALDKNRRFPLVVAANRDESFERPTAPLAWWAPSGGGPSVLGGRDLRSGGTWLGLTAEGRLGLLTNLHDSRLTFAEAPSRAEIVPNWLSARDTVDKFWMRTAVAGYNGFNLIAADFRMGECFWMTNSGVYPRRLERGVYGLSGAELDAPSPKVVSLKSKVLQRVEHAVDVDTLVSQLFDALSDRTPAQDDKHPRTGGARDRERQLSSAFVRIPGEAYGTRCSTLIITERVSRYLVTHVLERSFGLLDGQTSLLRSTIRRWPPRHTSQSPTPAIEHAAVAELAEVS
jgi:uncharacterized protein with NRDE domain